MKTVYLLFLGMLLNTMLAQAQTCSTTISTFPYFEHFENGVGNWTIGGTGSSWALGTPSKTTINSAASGTHSWVTNLTGDYNTGENSWIVGPCFNFTALTAPVISMKVWWNSESGWDGAVLQSSIDGGSSWQNVGAVPDPDNWYNSVGISAGPGGQAPLTAEGWSGRTFSIDGSGGWVKAKHTLTGLAGQGSVKLRIAFAADSSVQDDGFAFDDFAVYEAPANDVGVIAITSPVGSNCGASATETVCITIKNFGTATQTSIPVRYQIGTNLPVTETFTGSLASNTTATYCFATKANLGSSGTYQFTANTTLTGDNFSDNDTASTSVVIVNPITTFPYLVDFENCTAGNGNNHQGTPPLGWVVNPVMSGFMVPYMWMVNAGPTYSTATGPNVDHTLGTATGKYIYVEASYGIAGDMAEFVTPCINLTNLPTPGLSFWYHMNGNTMGTLDVEISTNNGTTWTTLTTFSGQQQASESSPWKKRTLSLAGYTGIVQVRFKATLGSLEFSDIAIDDVKFYTLPASDAELVAMTAPVASSGCGFSATETVCVSVRNGGNTTLTNIPVSYAINGGTTITETLPGPLAPGDTTQYCFTTKANLSNVGTFSFFVKTNLSTDGDPSNDDRTRVITVNPMISTFPYSQNFENGAGFWTAGGTASSWALGTPAKPVITGAASGTKAWVTNLTGNYNTSETSYVMGPCFNLSAVVAPVFEMKVWWNSEWSWDGTVLQSSIDGGATWQNVGAYGNPNHWYNDSTIDAGPGGQNTLTAQGWTGTTSGSHGSNGWVTAKHLLSGLGSHSSVLLRIAFGSDTGVEDDGFAFDDVSISESPANDLQVLAITAPATSTGCSFSATETVCISIKNHGSATTTSFPVSYAINGGPAVTETATLAIPSGAIAQYCFTTKANLGAVGTYSFVAKTHIPSDSNPANDSSARVFTVIPTVSSFPYTQDFENGAAGWTPVGSVCSWALGTPAKTVIIGAASGTKAWATSLTGTPVSNENSYVLSPCFNFSNLADPDFEMKAWWESQPYWDGTVLQSSIDGGATWQNVGAYGNPNNWYNSNIIGGAPGGQAAATAEGWCGSNSYPIGGSNGWVKVRHKLTGLGGQASVMLRVAYGADANINYDGFAFDDIRIGDDTGNLAINSFVPLTQICGFGNNEKVEVVLENLGSAAVTGFQVSYTVDGGAPVTQSYTGSLAFNTPTNYIFPVGANLSGPGQHTIVVTVTNPNDPDPTNNSVTYTLANAFFPTLPVNLDFETTANGITATHLLTKPNSNIIEGPAASFGATSTKGLIMDGVDNPAWITPAGVTDPWTNNPDNFSAAYICFNPGGGSVYDSLWLTFDLKQLFKTGFANTNFRITVNGAQVGPTHTPPFAGTPIVWTSVKVDLTPFKNLPGIRIGFESSVKEAIANGTGTANLLDNIQIKRRIINGVKGDLLATKLSVYPNPSNGQFNVGLQNGKAYSLEVTDLAGRSIIKQTVKGDTQLKLENAAKGIYLLKVTSEGTTTVRKLIVE